MSKCSPTKKLCICAMLIAIAFVLGSFSLRVGVGIKISFKFIPVVICAVFFGPVYAGLCGAISDILAYFVNSAGGYLWQYTLIEFLYGFSYGLFFKNADKLNKKTIIMTIICVLLNTIVLTNFADAYVLKDLMGRGYVETMLYRMPSTVINMCFRFIGIFVILKFIPSLKKVSKLTD